MSRQNNTIRARFIPAILILLSSLQSCVIDPADPIDTFEGPSSYQVEFLSGSFTGRIYDLKSNSTIPDHEFRTGPLIQKVFSKPLQTLENPTLAGSSFVNWAWQADTIPGAYPAIFATDPSVSKSGDLQLIFNSGDELITSIPKGSSVNVEAYGGPRGAIEGFIQFTSALDYRLNGVNRRETAAVEIRFKIKRGPNI